MRHKSHVLKGVVCTGAGTASQALAPYMESIRAQTSLSGLVDGTLNIRLLIGSYVGHPDFIYRRTQRNFYEDTYMERCRVRGVSGLIMRTRGKLHGDDVLELMGEVKFRDAFDLKDGDTLEIEVFDP